MLPGYGVRMRKGLHSKAAGLPNMRKTPVENAKARQRANINAVESVAIDTILYRSTYESSVPKESINETHT